MMASAAERQVESTFQQGLALHRQGHVDAARHAYEEVLTASPRHVQALIFLSLIELDFDRPARVVELTDRAVSIDPRSVAAHLTRGHALSKLQQYPAAIVSYDRVIALNPEFPGGHFHRGNTALLLRRYEAALADYDRVVSLSSGDAACFVNRGVALKALMRRREALASFDRALALEGVHRDAWYHRGGVLAELLEYPEALAAYDRVIELYPSDAEAHSDRGNVLCELRRHEAALDAYARALDLNPRSIQTYCNRANLLCSLGRLAEARADFDHALRMVPENARAQFGRAFVRLLSGDLEGGWTDYESRWRVEGSLTASERRSFDEPRWTGEEPLAGKTLFIHREQGLGDTLQFCRYVPLLAERGARVVMEAHEPLLRLLRSLPGLSLLVARGSPLPPFDYWCPLMSLPEAFGTRLDSIPAPHRYLSVDPAVVNRWRERLGSASLPRIGLVWSGGTVHPNDHNRSIALRELLAYLPAGCTYLSLQKEVRDSDREALDAAHNLVSVADEITDFIDTAALCECVDLVVSVDTSVAHLGAAMGRPTWILLPRTPDWRWLLDRSDSPWYPSVTLYRQSNAGEWSDVLRRVAVDLERITER